MKLLLSFNIFAAALLLASCGGNKASGSDAQQASEAAAPEGSASATVSPEYVVGQWVIEEIGMEGSKNIHPDQSNPAQAQMMVFYPDNMVGISTNCNSLGGEYALDGADIRFSSMARTEMACDDMTVEEALAKLMPALVHIDVLSDTTMLLNAEAAGNFLLLRKVSDSAE